MANRKAQSKHDVLSKRNFHLTTEKKVALNCATAPLAIPSISTANLRLHIKSTTAPRTGFISETEVHLLNWSLHVHELANYTFKQKNIQAI